MPSLILEHTDKTDAHRTAEGKKWLQSVYERYNISQGYYRGIEFVFRQCLMHERFNSSFAYENENSIKFPIGKDKFREAISSTMPVYVKRKSMDLIFERPKLMMG